MDLFLSVMSDLYQKCCIYCHFRSRSCRALGPNSRGKLRIYPTRLMRYLNVFLGNGVSVRAASGKQTLGNVFAAQSARRNMRKLSDLEQEDRWMRRGVDGLWLPQPVCKGQWGWSQVNFISRASPWQKHTQTFLSLKLLIYAYNSILVFVFLRHVSPLSGKFKASPSQRRKKAH